MRAKRRRERRHLSLNTRTADSMADAAPTSLRALLAAPKGSVEFLEGESFILTVFWEAPSAAAAQTLLDALGRCAAATHRDAPAVPTYFFRVSKADASLCSPMPRTVGEHPQFAAAVTRLKRGVPAAAVCAGVAALGLSPELLELAPEAPLPVELQQQPVAVEFTEVYLDCKAFYDHAGSRECVLSAIRSLFWVADARPVGY